MYLNQLAQLDVFAFDGLNLDAERRQYTYIHLKVMRGSVATKVHISSYLYVQWTLTNVIIFRQFGLSKPFSIFASLFY